MSLSTIGSFGTITFNSTTGQSGAGTSGDPILENDITITPATISAKKATVEVDCIAVPFSGSIT